MIPGERERDAPPGYSHWQRIHQGRGRTVYRAWRTSDSAPVVLKTTAAADPSAADLARLEHEYAILASLEVPGMVRALGIEPIGESLALVLEDLSAENLRD